MPGHFPSLEPFFSTSKNFVVICEYRAFPRIPAGVSLFFLPLGVIFFCVFMPWVDWIPNEVEPSFFACDVHLLHAEDVRAFALIRNLQFCTPAFSVPFLQVSGGGGHNRNV